MSYDLFKLIKLQLASKLLKMKKKKTVVVIVQENAFSSLKFSGSSQLSYFAQDL